MARLDAPALRACPRCGGLLARDNSDEWCRPCLRSRRDYDPRSDPYFLTALLACLEERPGELVDPVRALGLESEWSEFVKSRIRMLRRLSYDIRGAARCRGYRLVGTVDVSLRPNGPSPKA